MSQTPPVGFGASSKPADIATEVMASPIPDDMTAEAARHLLAYYNLGKGAGTDLLTVSFSATDYVGHRYGTQGPEMCDQMHRLDRNVGAVLAAVDALHVPYLVVLSADHGSSDFVERLAERGYPAGRVDGAAVMKRVNDRLQAELGLAAPPLRGTLDEPDVTVQGADRARVMAAAVRALAAQPEVAGAFTQDELLATPVGRGVSPEALTLAQRMARSVYKGRNSDILVALQPYTSLAQPNPGSYLAAHTGPWDYDRRVPILFWWKGAPSQTRALPIETADIAPTLAAVLGLTPPADVDGRCLPLADKGPAACPTR